MMKIFIASDHAGVELKSKIIKAIESKSLTFLSQKSVPFEIHDLGPSSTDSVDYPDYADLVARQIRGLTLIELNTHSGTSSDLTEVGILICGSGQGMCMRANKFPAVRAALCWNPESAQLARQHNNANILCLGARLVAEDICLQIVDTFLTTPFLGGRHAGRVAKVLSPI